MIGKKNRGGERVGGRGKRRIFKADNHFIRKSNKGKRKRRLDYDLQKKERKKNKSLKTNNTETGCFVDS